MQAPRLVVHRRDEACEVGYMSAIVGNIASDLDRLALAVELGPSVHIADRAAVESGLGYM